MPLTETQLERYARQIVLPKIGLKGQEKLLESNVLVIGAGGLGSIALMHLSACGIGHIGIVDHDKVSLSNLHRQIIYSSEDIGKAKVTSAKENLNKINSDIKITTYNEKFCKHNVDEILSGFDIIIDGLDNFKDKFLLNDACVSINKNLIHAGVIGFEGQILTITKDSACLRCFLPDIPDDINQNCSELGIIGPCVGVISSLIAGEAIKLILDIGATYSNRILKYNSLNGKFFELKTEGKNKDCHCRH